MAEVTQEDIAAVLGSQQLLIIKLNKDIEELHRKIAELERNGTEASHVSKASVG